MLGAVHLYVITSYHPTISIILNLLLMHLKRLYFLETLQAYSSIEQKMQRSHVSLPPHTHLSFCEHWKVHLSEMINLHGHISVTQRP